MRRLRAALAAAAVLAGTASLSVASAPPGQAATNPVVWGFGLNSHGQLGDGTFTQRNSPARVLGALNNGAMVTQIAAGGFTSAALLSNGTVWTWGDNTFGLLGNGEADGNARTSPGQVPGLSGITQISLSPDGSAAYALGPGGVVWAWGMNNRGQLGNGTTSPSAVPQQVPGLTGITKISAGVFYALALDANGNIWAWGDNDDYELGDGTTTERHTPVSLDKFGFVTVAADGPASFAAKGDGTLFVWGSDPGHIGVLGFGDLNSIPSPGFLSTVPGVRSIADGGDHVLVQTFSGTVYAWGANNNGQLGDGTNVNKATPEQLRLTNVASVTATVGVSAATGIDGTLWTWGDDTWGGLGNGTCCATFNPNPVQVTSLASVPQLAFGISYGLAVGTTPPPPPPAQVTVPDLHGSTEDGATARLQAVGLVLGDVAFKTDKSCDNIGTVLDQSPKSGQQVSPGSAVSITIGTQPKSPPCP